MVALLLFFSFLISTCTADPQIFLLNKYNSSAGFQQLSLEVGGNLYLASSDDIGLLKNIQVVIGEVFYTLDQLANGQSVKVTAAGVGIRSSNSDSVTAAITGFLYATTAEQANDILFYVTVVNGAQTLIQKDKRSTNVVLNTAYKYDFPAFDVPDKTTYVTGIEQFTTTQLNFHYGIPPANYTKVTENQFFENPQFLPNYDEHGEPTEPTREFFTKIEPLQINLPYWYITADGPYNMGLKNQYMDVHEQNPATENATGVFVINDILLQQTVNFKVDYSRKRHIGFLITTINSRISLFMTGGQSSFTQNYNPDQIILHGQIITGGDENKLVINSTELTPGTFYCQYFMMSGDYYPVTSTKIPTTTTVVTSTPTTVMTTTKSGRSFGVTSLFGFLLTFFLF